MDEVKSCRICKLRLSTVSSNFEHFREFHEGLQPFGCTECVYTCNSITQVKMHFDSVHIGIMYSCNQCEYNTAWKASLENHVESIHENKTFSCNICSFVTKWKISLCTHK